MENWKKSSETNRRDKMKIMICGSMSFSKQMLETKEALEEMGHKAMIAPDTHQCLKNPELSMSWEHCMQTEIDKKCFNLIEESDAILVLNYPKNGIEGYVGGATLMEIGLARHLNKKIFLMHHPPNEEKLRYSFEIKVARPTVIDGNLEKIS